MKDNTPISIRELRIGNLLEFEGKVVHVTSLSCDIDDEYGKTTDEKVGWNQVIALRCIPITSKWLKRLDVVEETFLLKLAYTDFFLRYSGKDSVDISIEDLNGNNHFFRYNIKYLHQLQNLYFALTGEELTIK